MGEPAPGPGQFRCEACGGVFGKVLTEEEAEAQFRREFPGHSASDDCGLACDNCYEKMKASGLFNPS